jgi:hypothetical protein
MSQEIRSDQLHQILGPIMLKPGEDSATAAELRAELGRLRWEIGLKAAGLEAAAKSLPTDDRRVEVLSNACAMLRMILTDKAAR